MKTNRINGHTVELLETGVPTKIYVNEHISLERAALEELHSFSQLPGLLHVSASADFHKGAGTPIGTTALIDRVYPQVTGNDLGCGMRLDVTNLADLDVTPDLLDKIRHTFFEGGRDVNVKDRTKLLNFGLSSINSMTNNLFGSSCLNIPSHNNLHADGELNPKLGFGAGAASILDSYAQIPSDRDNFLGSIGGGNHFVELQRVEQVLDKTKAYEAGIKVGSYCIMCHSGSLDLGHVVGNYYTDKAKKEHSGKYPPHGYFSLSHEQGEAYIEAAYNAANFATVNRAVLASMLATVLGSSIKDSVYDSPHNLIWRTESGYLHRKGSCPAELDEWVMIPGSMGTASCLAVGLGFNGTLNSSPHGAGRVLNRNAARMLNKDLDMHVVTKFDASRSRPDIARELNKRLMEEAPSVYKDVVQVVASSESAGIIKPVAWLKPILTIKG